MPSKTLRISTPDGHADAFVAFPDQGERHPGVLMYGDAFNPAALQHHWDRLLSLLDRALVTG